VWDADAGTLCFPSKAFYKYQSYIKDGTRRTAQNSAVPEETQTDSAEQRKSAQNTVSSSFKSSSSLKVSSLEPSGSIRGADAPVAAAAAPQPEPPVPVEAIQQPRTVAVPKPNRYGQVLDALKERGINYPGGRRDAGEVAKCSAAPALIADAYATFEEWAGDFGMSNKSLWYVCQRIAAYQAWQDGKRARASPNGRAGGLTVQQLLRGEG